MFQQDKKRQVSLQLQPEKKVGFLQRGMARGGNLYEVGRPQTPVYKLGFNRFL